MPRKRSKSPYPQTEEWEKDVPEFTEEQMENQAEILKGLGKYKPLTENQLRQYQRRLNKLDPDARITDVEIHLPPNWKLPDRIFIGLDDDISEEEK